jgi:hypothetical protein
MNELGVSNFQGRQNTNTLNFSRYYDAHVPKSIHHSLMQYVPIKRDIYSKWQSH